MAIDGRINIDVLFHDTDGTTSLKIVSLEDSTAYTTGKVAIVTGTCGTTTVNIATVPSTFRNSSGELVTFSTLSRLVFAATPYALASFNNVSLPSANNEVAATSIFPAEPGQPGVRATAGTASYTLVMYGT